MNRNSLKYIAAVAMLLDHIGMVFSSFFMQTTWGVVLYSVLRVIGRLTAPIMCFFLVQGFLHTHSKKSYTLRLAIFAVVSQIPYALAHKNSFLTLDFNMLFTLLISFAMLCVWETRLETVPKTIVLLILVCASAFCDWGLFAPLLVLFFYVSRENRQKLIFSYCILVLFVCLMSCIFLASHGMHWYGELWQLGLFLFIPVLFIYNGEPGSRAAFHKWFFYVFYPLHLLLLWGIASSLRA